MAVFVLARAESDHAVDCVRDFLTRSRFEELEINGNDLLEAGIAPSPAVARGLEEALVAKIDGKINSRSDELTVALKTARSNNQGSKK